MLIVVVLMVVNLVRAQELRQNHYRVLGVSPSATTQEIKASFRKRAREKHPDKAHRSTATAEFSKLSLAYDTLRSPKRRSEYDALFFRGGLLSRYLLTPLIFLDDIRDMARNFLVNYWRVPKIGFGMAKTQKEALNATDVLILKTYRHQTNATFYKQLCRKETCWVVDCSPLLLGLSRCWRLREGTAFYVDPRRKWWPLNTNDGETNLDDLRRNIAKHRYQATPLRELRKKLKERPRDCIDKDDLTNLLLDKEFPPMMPHTFPHQYS